MNNYYKLEVLLLELALFLHDNYLMTKVEVSVGCYDSILHKHQVFLYGLLKEEMGKYILLYLYN